MMLFLLLGGGAFWYLNEDEAQQKTTLAGADRDFAVPDIERVHKIFIAGRKGERTTLERDGKGGWLYNGQFETNMQVVQPLLDVIQQVRIQYKPPVKAVDNMVKVLATEGMKVELYDEAGENLKTYYVGGATADERGTYMIMEGADQPYVVELPAWEGNVSVRFKRFGDEWRDKILFKTPIEEIASVSVEYPKQKNQSFRVSRAGGSFKVAPFYEITPEINRPFRSGSIEAFLVNFESIGAESFRNDHVKRDSVLRQIPFCTITLVDQQQDTTTASFYPMYPDNYVTQDPKTGEYLTPSQDIFRYFVWWNDKDFMFAQHMVVQKAFWGYPSFFQDAKLLN